MYSSARNAGWFGADTSPALPQQKLDRSRTDSQDCVPASVSDNPSCLAQTEAQEPSEQPARPSTAGRLSIGGENGEVAFQIPLKLPGRARTGFVRRAKNRKDTPKGLGRLYYKACMSLQWMCSCVTTRVRTMLPSNTPQIVNVELTIIDRLGAFSSEEHT